jgi:hypothetical protein
VDEVRAMDLKGPPWIPAFERPSLAPKGLILLDEGLILLDKGLICELGPVPEVSTVCEFVAPLAKGLAVLATGLISDSGTCISGKPPGSAVSSHRPWLKGASYPSS